MRARLSIGRRSGHRMSPAHDVGRFECLQKGLLMPKRRNAANWVPVAATTLAMVSCYGTLLAAAILPLLGLSLAAEGRIWARAAVVIFSGLSAAAVAASSAMRGKVFPVALSMSGFLLTALATYEFRSRPVEALGFALLIVAVAWDRSRKRSLPSPSNGSSCALQ